MRSAARSTGGRLTALLALAPLVGCGGGTPERDPVDHVLVILVDTLRADALGAYGAPDGSTPALDAFAAESAVFLQAHSQSSWTAPSMIALFSGRRVAEEALHLPGEIPVLAAEFQQAGFATAAFICNDIISEQSGFARGFDSMLQMVPYSENDPIVAWMRDHAEQKAFAYVHLNEAHDPYAEEEHAWPVLREDPPDLAAERRAYYEETHAALGLEDLEGSIAHIETELGGYADDVTFTDARIAELLEAVYELWPEDRTVIVVTSDHGEGLWTRVAMMAGQRGATIESGAPQTLVTTLMPTHGNQVHRELSHIPLIVQAPGLDAARIDGPVESIDLFPTLLELAQLPRPSGLAGTSLVDRMETSVTSSLVDRLEAGVASMGDAFTYTRFNSSLITANGWQLILPSEKGLCEEDLEVELYDLNSDPLARVNIAQRHPEQVERLSAIVVMRQQAGLTGYYQELNGTDRAVLEGLGYMDGGLVEQVKARFLEMSAADLIATITDDPQCLARLESARALRGKDLTTEQRAKLQERLGLEGSLAVRRVLDEVLED